jgi:hypothetical protein
VAHERGRRRDLRPDGDDAQRCVSRSQVVEWPVDEEARRPAGDRALGIQHEQSVQLGRFPEGLEVGREGGGVRGGQQPRQRRPPGRQLGQRLHLALPRRVQRLGRAQPLPQPLLGLSGELLVDRPQAGQGCRQDHAGREGDGHISLRGRATGAPDQVYRRLR